MSTSTSPTRKLKVHFQAIDGCIGHLNACQGLAEVLADRGHEVTFLVTSAEKAAAIEKLGPFRAIQLGDGSKVVEGHGHGHDHGGHHQGHQGHAHSHGDHQEKAKDCEHHDHQEKVKGCGHDHQEKAKGHDHAHAHPVAEQANANLARGAFARKTPLEQLQSQLDHFSTNAHLTGNFQTIIELTPKLEAMFADPTTRPDVLILDTFIISPAILKSGIPWVYLFSANPMGLYQGSSRMPPFGAGFPVSGGEAGSVDPSSWAEYKALQVKLGKKAYSTFQGRLNEQFNLDPSLDPYKSGNFFPQSPFLNVFGFPEELSYNDVAPMPEKTIAVDAFARNLTGQEEFTLPEGFWDPSSGEKLLFFSLGSQASANLDLMRRILSILGKHRAKYIVSKGPNGDQLQLPANCTGANYLPQPAILPLVDAVITHGGNNSFTETFAAGKPMLVLPLSGDHLDNAQRIEEKGYGLRLPTHDFTEQQLTEAVKKLLTDQELITRARKAGERIRAAQSKVRAAERIEALVDVVG